MVRLVRVPLWMALALVAACSHGGKPAVNEPLPPALVLIENGAAKGAIVIDDEAGRAGELAAQELNAHFVLASGAKLPVHPAADADRIAAGTPRVILGPGTLSRKLGVDIKPLGEEGYCIVTVGSDLVLAGFNKGPLKDISQKESAGTVWAAAEYLDRVLGVRWLWPGEFGTVVPRLSTIGAPALDIRTRPSLERRWLRAGGRGSSEELTRWLRRFQMGERSTHQFRHAFTQWWEKYGKTHPEYFAVPPAGSKFQQPHPKPDRIKLNLGNPAVTEAIIKEWKDAGMPDNWNVTPNDSASFCTSPESMALDLPEKYKPEDVWVGSVSLTRRYVRFWNQLVTRMRAIKPGVTISVYAYQSYRDLTPDLKLEPGIAVGMIHGYNSETRWEEWHKAGAMLYLRPNWWHVGGSAPHIPIHRVAEHYKFAAAHGMLGFDFDSLTGFWGTQGINYYLIARISSRPDLGAEDVINEYVSAFGPAGEAVREYLDYWEKFTTKAAYPLERDLAQDPNGLYEQTAIKNGLFARGPLAGSYQLMPYLFTDDVLKPAAAILERASAAASSGEPIHARRVKFLADALGLFVQQIEVVRLLEPKTRKAGETAEDVKKAVGVWRTRRDAFVSAYGELHRGDAVPRPLSRMAADIDLGF